MNATLKATYSTAKEIAELYINSGLKDSTDVRVLVNEISKMLVQKHGLDTAKEICRPFANASIFTEAGLCAFLEAVNVDRVNFTDPLTGEITHVAYIHLK